MPDRGRQDGTDKPRDTFTAGIAGLKYALINTGIMLLLEAGVFAAVTEGGEPGRDRLALRPSLLSATAGLGSQAERPPQPR